MECVENTILKCRQCAAHSIHAPSVSVWKSEISFSPQVPTKAIESKKKMDNLPFCGTKMEIRETESRWQRMNCGQPFWINVLTRMMENRNPFMWHNKQWSNQNIHSLRKWTIRAWLCVSRFAIPSSGLFNHSQITIFHQTNFIFCRTIWIEMIRIVSAYI